MSHTTLHKCSRDTTILDLCVCVCVRVRVCVCVCVCSSSHIVWHHTLNNYEPISFPSVKYMVQVHSLLWQINLYLEKFHQKKEIIWQNVGKLHS